MANRIAQHALENNLIKELKNNDLIKPEVFFNKERRLIPISIGIPLVVFAINY